MKQETSGKFFFHYRLSNSNTKQFKICKTPFKRKKKRSRNKISSSFQDSGLKLKKNNQTKSVEMGVRSTEKNLLQDFMDYSLFCIAPWTCDIVQGTQLEGNNSCAQTSFQGCREARNISLC